jgi:cation transport ATPase
MRCQDCAAVISIEVGKLSGVDKAELDFVKGQLIVEGNPDLEAVKATIEHLGNRVQPETDNLTQKHSTTKVLDFLGFWKFFIHSKDLPIMGVGLLVLILGIVLQQRFLPAWVYLPLQLASLPMLGILVFRQA